MSWFTEIAGKAEDLLNRVDKTAATALQNKTKFGSSSDVCQSDFSVKPFSESTFSPVNPKPLNFGSSTPNVANVRSSKSFNHIYSTQKKQPESDDEKLLQFLNSNEPVAKSPVKKQEGKKLQEANKSEQIVPDSTFIAANQQPDSLEKSEPAVPQQDVKIPEEHLIVEMQQLEQSSAAIEVDASKEEGEESNQQNVVQSELPSSIINDFVVPDEIHVTKLKEELLQTSKRADYAQSEMKRMQKKLEHWNSQISGNDKLVRELQEREKDHIAALDAKDSQLAVLKVRFEEADQEVKNTRAILHNLKSENERLVKSHSDEVSMHNQTIDALRMQLVEVETDLSKSREAYRSAQSEHMVRIGKLEEQQRHLAENVTNYERKLKEVNEKNKELTTQVQNANQNVENLQREYEDYKQKAQRILQSKEKLISDLKENNFDSSRTSSTEPAYDVLSAEADGIKQERDLLREELRRANENIESLRNEIQDLEKMSQAECETSRQHYRNLEEQLAQERLLTEEIQLLNSQLKEEMQFLKEDLQHTKTSLQSRIQDREAEIDKLRKQLTAKSMSTVSQDELESRLHALTENLIQKQTVVEALSTEKNSLVLQLERLEQQLKEAQHYGSQLHTVVGLSSSENDRKQKPVVFLDNPFDSTLTRRVKKMYGGIDAFSIRLGVFFRRYPIARLFVIVYMFLLHLWVMIVLLTYEPEAHNASYKVVNNA